MMPVFAVFRGTKGNVMEVQCPSCQRTLKVKDTARGESVTCPHCRASIPLKQSANDQPRDLLASMLKEVRRIESAQSTPASSRTAASALLEAPPSPRPSEPGAKKALEEPAEGHFPQRTSKAYQKGASPRRGPILAVLAGVLVVGLAAYAAIHFIRTGIHTQAARVALKKARDSLPAIGAKMEAGDAFVEEENFKAALDAYCDVISMAQPLVTRLRDVSSDLKPGKLRAEVQTLSSELSQHLALALEKSEDPNVKMRAQGLVDFDGEWVTPEQKAAAIEAKMKAEGRQLYEGKWLTEAEKHKAKGEVQYQGRWVTREMWEELQKAAQEVAVKPPAPAPAPIPPPVPTAPDFKDRDIEWVLDDFERGAVAWSSVRWPNANPCQLSRTVEDGSGRLKIVLTGGPHDKSAIVRPLRANFSTRLRLRMDVTNNCGEPLRIAIAIQTNTYYESRWFPQPLPIGVNKNVSFNLQTSDYKCATTNWSAASRIGRLDAVTDVFILFYNTSGEVLLDNLSALSK